MSFGLVYLSVLLPELLQSSTTITERMQPKEGSLGKKTTMIELEAVSVAIVPLPHVGVARTKVLPIPS